MTADIGIRSVGNRKIAVMPCAGTVRVEVTTYPIVVWSVLFSTRAATRFARVIGEILAGRNAKVNNVPTFDGGHVAVSRYDNPVTFNSNVMLECSATNTITSGTTILPIDKAEKLAEAVSAAAEIAATAESDEQAAEQFGDMLVFIAL